jgi:predicted cobalt transporter CbtA
MSTTTYTGLLVRGLAAGGIAGLAAGLIGLVVVEAPIRAALAVEEARAAAEHTTGDHAHAEVFDRSTQIVGGVLAAIVVGLALGAVFATAYAYTRRWFTDREPFTRSLTLGLAAFGVAALLPAIKYPANPPAVGDPTTVNYRTGLYLGLIVAGVVLAYGASYLASRLGHLTAPVRTTAVLLATVVAVVVLLLVFPAPPDAIPADMPSDVLWDFRLASLAETATLWIGLGLAFGLLIDPAVRKAKTRTAVAF